MTQIRFAGLIGPGEVLLILGAVAALVIPRRGGVARLDPRFYLAIALVAAVALEMTLASVVHWYRTNQFPFTSLSDGVSVWAAVIFTAAVLFVGRRYENVIEIIAWSCVFTVLPSLLMYLSVKAGVAQIGSLEFMYDSVRFQGLSTDPNQLGRVCAISPFLMAYMALRSRRNWAVFFVAVAGASIVVGLATESQSTWIAWGLGGIAALGWSFAPRGVAGRVLATISVGLMVGVLAVAMFGGVFSASFAAFSGQLEYLASVGGEARFEIAELSLQVVNESARTVLLGHGFGFHVLWLAPANRVLEMESHNIILDVLVRGGLLAFIPFAILLGWAFLKGLTGRGVALAVLLASLAMGLSVTPIRQPIFWLAIIACTGGPWVTERRRIEAPRALRTLSS